MELPDGLDARLWFPCGDVSGARDYLYPAAWHTFPGRMGAWCAAKGVWFRVSAHEVLPGAPEASQFWVAGYLAGSLPRAPEDLDEAGRERWRDAAAEYFRTGVWTGPA